MNVFSLSLCLCARSENKKTSRSQQRCHYLNGLSFGEVIRRDINADSCFYMHSQAATGSLGLNFSSLNKGCSAYASHTHTHTPQVLFYAYAPSLLRLSTIFMSSERHAYYYCYLFQGNNISQSAQQSSNCLIYTSIMLCDVLAARRKKKKVVKICFSRLINQTASHVPVTFV